MKKEISSVQNWKEAFWETALCSVNSSHRLTSFPSRSLSLRTVLVELAKGYLEAHTGLWWKRKYLQLILKRSFLKNCFVFCYFISQGYSFPFKKYFAKTVLVEFPKWYLLPPRLLLWKSKYLPLKTGKKLSEKLLCVLLTHHTELQDFPQEAFPYDFSGGICKVIFGSPMRAMVKKEMSSVKNWKEAFWETA